MMTISGSNFSYQFNEQGRVTSQHKTLARINWLNEPVHPFYLEGSFDSDKLLLTIPTPQFFHPIDSIDIFDLSRCSYVHLNGQKCLRMSFLKYNLDSVVSADYENLVCKLWHIRHWRTNPVFEYENTYWCATDSYVMHGVTIN